MKKNKETAPIVKKTILDKVKSLLSSACVIFTVIMAVIYVIGSLTQKSHFGPHIYIMWMILGVSVAFALAEKFYAVCKNFVLKLIGHFIISLAGFYLILSLGVQHLAKDETNARAVAGVFIFVVLYAVIMGARIAIVRFIEGRGEKSDDYESVFEKDSKGK